MKMVGIISGMLLMIVGACSGDNFDYDADEFKALENDTYGCFIDLGENAKVDAIIAKEGIPSAKLHETATAIMDAVRRELAQATAAELTITKDTVSATDQDWNTTRAELLRLIDQMLMNAEAGDCKSNESLIGPSQNAPQDPPDLDLSVSPMATDGLCTAQHAGHIQFHFDGERLWAVQIQCSPLMH